MIREEKKREDGGKEGGGWMARDLKKEAGMWEGVDLGDGGRVSECWWCWVMKYSVRVCLWLLPSLFPPFRHRWLTVLFIGVPVVQGTHLQSLFLCTLSELREGDKERGRDERRGEEREGKIERAGSTEMTFMNN